MLFGKQVHGLDLGQLGQHGLFDVLLQGHAVHVGLPYFLPKHTLVLVLGIGQVDHDLRQHTGHGLDPKHLILFEPGVKHQLGISLCFPAAPFQKQKQGAEEKDKEPFKVSHHKLPLPTPERMLLATLIPLAEACCSPLVTPAPSPIARRPLMLVWKSLSTITRLE